MATWVNISNANLQPGAPARSVDALALRDNPIALAEGAAGAPRIQTAAIQDGAITNAKIANGAVTWAKVSAGSIYIGMGAIPAGAIGSVAMVARSTAGLVTPISWGELVPGSAIRPSNSGGADVGATITQLSGTWRILGGGLPVPSRAILLWSRRLR